MTEFKSGYPSGLTASAFEVLLHYFYTPADSEAVALGEDTAVKALQELQVENLIEPYANDHGGWRLTERGLVLARCIMEMPLPVQSWQMPSNRSDP